MKLLQMGRVLCCVMLVTGTLAAVAADNLVPDPAFHKAIFTPLTEASSWVWYEINAPSTASLNAKDGTITLTGGRTFLHSSKFVVAAGKKYRVELTAQGTGKASIEFLWWTATDGTASTHDMIAVEPVALQNGQKKLETVVTAPDNAGKAYIRVVVTDGTLTLSAPRVTLAE